MFEKITCPNEQSGGKIQEKRNPPLDGYKNAEERAKAVKCTVFNMGIGRGPWFDSRCD